jgi:hypothetical protein
MNSWCIEKGDTKTPVQWIGEASKTRWKVCPSPVFVTAQYSSDPPTSGTHPSFQTNNAQVFGFICLLESWVKRDTMT